MQLKKMAVSLERGLCNHFVESAICTLYIALHRASAFDVKYLEIV